MFTDTDQTPDAPVFSGVSFCAAVTEAARSGPLIVRPESIQVCKWAPVVLGFKQPENAFEKELAPTLTPPVKAVLLGPADDFPAGFSPEAVIVRGEFETLCILFNYVGPDRWATELGQGTRIDVTALDLLLGHKTDTLFHRLSRKIFTLFKTTATGRMLSAVLFRSKLITRLFEALIKRTMASMSVCRNSVVAPIKSGRVNFSYFCAGGIAWGGNEADEFTSGWPIDLYDRIKDRLIWEGKKPG